MPILTDQERIGTLLGERYRVDAILGRGGMGVVFRAHEEANGQPVAVKILRPELAQSDAQFAKRFIREARAAATVHHPNVVEIFDVGEEPDGTIYQVLELLVGETLREHLARKDKLDAAMMLELLLPVIHALEAAHTAGIVHRDLKPDNIYLARQASGEAKPTLLDFGIAKLLDTRGGSFATNTGSIMGTPAYMAPEQAGGYKNQGPAIDIWAMGIIAFECLAGAPPFTGASPAQVMLRIMTETPPPLDTLVPDVPPHLADVIAKALVRSPAERHPDMSSFREALRAAAVADGVALPDEGRPSTTRILSIAPQPDPDEDVGSAATDAVGGHDSGEGVATMAAKLRHDRAQRERARADALTQAKRASDSIDVAIEAVPAPPAAERHNRYLVLGAAIVIAVLGVGIGLTLAGGGGASGTGTTSAAPATTSVVPPTPAVAPPPTTSVAPPPSTSVIEPPTTVEEPAVTPPPTTTRAGRGPRAGRDTGMSTAPTTTAATMEAATMETTMATTMRGGGLPSVVGWEDE